MVAQLLSILTALSLLSGHSAAKKFSGYTPIAAVDYSGSSSHTNRTISFRLYYGEGDGLARTKARVSAILFLDDSTVKADRNVRPGGTKNHTFNFNMTADEDWKTAVFYLVEDDTGDASVYELTNPNFAPSSIATPAVSKWKPTHTWKPAHRWKPARKRTSKYHHKLRKRKGAVVKKVAAPAPTARAKH